MRSAPADFDHIIVGAGLSGLLLGRALLGRAYQKRHGERILLIDPRGPETGPATYSYWTCGNTYLDRWQIGGWRELVVVDRSGVSHRAPLNGWRYAATDWGIGRAQLLAEVTTESGVDFLPHAAESVWDEERAGCVRVNGMTVTGSWVYDSRPPAPDLSGPNLIQAFHGVWVAPDHGIIDSSAATLMDFSTDESPYLGFSYVLPVSAQRAMVMAVRMSTDPQRPDPMPAVARLLGSEPWHVVAHESGLTPLAVGRSARGTGKHVVAIGGRGGRVRPSTGYAATRILRDTARIRRSLDRHDHPFDIPPDSWRQQILDRIWLRALAREGAALEPAFVRLFTQAPIDSVLSFLDGHARPDDLAAVVRALPPKPFLRALLP